MRIGSDWAMAGRKTPVASPAALAAVPVNAWRRLIVMAYSPTYVLPKLGSSLSRRTATSEQATDPTACLSLNCIACRRKNWRE